MSQELWIKLSFWQHLVYHEKKGQKKEKVFYAKNWTIVEIKTGKKNNVSKS